jgi:predicted amidophosphoribosyltransferase
VARRCFVCGFKSRETVCPQCNTILLTERAACARCGKAFEGWIAVCDACGGSTLRRPEGPKDRDAVRALASVPGISQDRAKVLVAKGFREFADLVRLALPENAVRIGLHHTIARKALLVDLVARPERPMSGARCPMCGAPWTVNATECLTCGSAADFELDPAMMEQKLEEITGEIVDLAADDDFQGMPETLQQEFLQAFGTENPEELLRDECRHQIEAWRQKGFDVERVEQLLEEDLARFREGSARLIRVQVRKRWDAGTYRCPLCEVSVPSTAEECGNCGARFA